MTKILSLIKFSVEFTMQKNYLWVVVLYALFYYLAWEKN